ncbi:hypothetical protein PENSPDRAFT_274112 [Peniophora sp. CONT]|nr:hypothetical protein PENSPDRAFT_274112 [Peniophora sp. CONT]
MIGLDRTPGVLPALPASNFPWPMGDESAPLTSTNIMARHTAKPDASSPQRQSSLTPAPDSSSPNTKAEAHSKSPENSNEDASNAGLVDDGGAPSPLSELSPAPEEDDEDDGLEPKEEGGDSKKDEGKPTGASNTPPRPNGVSKKHAAPNAEASSSSSPLRGSYPHQGEHSASSSRSALPGSAKRNRKIDALIQLNGELFKALDEFHSRSIPKDDKRFTEFNSRLHSNLTWLANAADNPQALVGMNSLPPLSTPQSVDFLPMDRILQLYKELGAAFAKDIARMRESAHHPPAQGPPMIPGSLKRERPEHATPEPMNKRRDTGEHKTPMLPPSTPASMGRGFPPGVGGAPSTPQMAASSPSIPSQGFPMNTTQAEMQRRAAQLQMRGQQQAAAQRPTQTSPHQMQPPPVPGPGPSAGGNINAGNPVVQQVVAQFGQNGLRVLQMLQTPNQPIIQQILKNYPQFPTLPLGQQVQAVLRFTGALDRERQHTQQQQQQQQHGVGGGMPMQGGQGGIPLSRMGSGGPPGAPMGVPSQGGPSGISVPPGGFTQAQLMAMPHQQRQMLMMQQQMRNGPGGGGGGGMQGGINPAAFGGGAGGPGGMQQGGINPAVFGPGGGQGGVNPAILQQQQQRLMQQQAAQQQQQHQGGGMGSPMHAGSPANDFGGMQRSTHSPSENAPSPMTPRGGPGGGGGADFQRMMAMQAAQANAPSPAPSNSGGGGGGFINPQQMMAGGGGQGAGWQQQNSGSAGGPYGGTPPGSAHGRPQQQFPPSAPSPGAGGWPGSAGAGGGSGGPGGGYPYAPSPVHQMGGPQQQQRPPSRTASAAGGGFPGMDPSSSPGMGMSGGMDAGLGDFSEFFNTQSWS